MSNINKSEQKLKDQTIDALLSYAVEIANEELIAELKNAEPVEFSDRHKKQMEKLFNSAKKKKPAIFYARRIAAVFLIFFVMAGVSVMSVDVWRVKFFNFFTKTSQTNTEIRFEEKTPASDVYSTDEVTLNYIPAGMQLKENIQKNGSIRLMFAKDEQFFRLRVTRVDYTSFVDTENKNAEKVKLNDAEGFLQTIDDKYSLKWSSDKYIYTLSSNLDRETTIKIAENIK